MADQQTRNPGNDEESDVYLLPQQEELAAFVRSLFPDQIDYPDE